MSDVTVRAPVRLELVVNDAAENAAIRARRPALRGPRPTTRSEEYLESAGYAWRDRLEEPNAQEQVRVGVAA